VASKSTPIGSPLIACASSGSRKKSNTSVTAMMPNGMLMKKIQRQSSASMSTPPSTGPSAGPQIAAIVKMP
jgi:hypothetical protein